MNPFRGQFHHWAKEEIALGQVRMRHLQIGGINDLIIHGHDIYINQTVDVIAIFVTVGSAAQAALYLVYAVKHLVWRQRAAQAHSYIQETILALKSPRLALDD